MKRNWWTKEEDCGKENQYLNEIAQYSQYQPTPLNWKQIEGTRIGNSASFNS